MAEAAVRRASEEEASECLETQSVGAVSDPKMADKKGKRRSTRSSSKSKKDDEDSKIASLEKKMEEQFSTIMTMMQSMSEAQAERDKHAREEREIRASEVQNGGSASHSTRVLNENDPLGLRIDHSDSHSDNSSTRGARANDEISLAPGQTERDEVLSQDSDDEFHSRRSVSSYSARISSAKRDKYSRYLRDESDDNNNRLNQIFGEISVPTKDDVGIVLDQAQINILNGSWRSSDPEKLTAYKDEYKVSFPVQTKSQDTLKVPVLDDLLEPLLRKQHSNFKAWGKAKHLASQQMRSIENSAYQGQIAARMGIISVAYMQQALGLLLKNLKSDTPNVDSAVQSVRDIFDMSTKTLDQVGRTGAFHHVVRRKAAVSDTGLNAVKDIQSKIQGLPLSAEGVFGPGLEEKLKQRKDQKEQLSDLLPEYSGGSNKQQKRKYSSTGSSSYYDSGSRWNNKRQKSNDYDSRRSRSSGYQRPRSYDNQRGKADDQGKGRKGGSFRSNNKR